MKNYKEQLLESQVSLAAHECHAVTMLSPGLGFTITLTILPDYNP